MERNTSLEELLTDGYAREEPEVHAFLRDYLRVTRRSLPTTPMPPPQASATAEKKGARAPAARLPARPQFGPRVLGGLIGLATALVLTLLVLLCPETHMCLPRSTQRMTTWGLT